MQPRLDFTNGIPALRWIRWNSLGRGSYFRIGLVTSAIICSSAHIVRARRSSDNSTRKTNGTTSHGKEALSRSGRLMLVLPCCAGRCQPDLHKLDRCRTSPQPSPYGDQRPTYLKHSEGPRPLEESVDGTKDTGCCKGQDERSTAIFQRVADQHRGNCRQAKKSESIHAGYVSDRSIELERSMSSCYASRLSLGE
jgi:hypothetical protein